MNVVPVADVEKALVGASEPAGVPGRKRKARLKKPPRRRFTWPWERYDPPMLPPTWVVTVVGWALHSLVGQGRPLRKDGMERKRERDLRHFLYRVDAIAFLQLCGDSFQAYVYYASGYPGEAMPHLLAMLAFTSILFAHTITLTAIRYTAASVFIVGTVISYVGQVEGWVAVVWLSLRVLHVDFDGWEGWLPGIDRSKATFVLVSMPEWTRIITVISLTVCLVWSISGIFMIRDMAMLVIKRLDRKEKRKLRAKRMALKAANEAREEKKTKRRRGSDSGSASSSADSESDDEEAARRVQLVRDREREEEEKKAFNQFKRLFMQVCCGGEVSDDEDEDDSSTTSDVPERSPEPKGAMQTTTAEEREHERKIVREKYVGANDGWKGGGAVTMATTVGGSSIGDWTTRAYPCFSRACTCTCPPRGFPPRTARSRGSTSGGEWLARNRWTRNTTPRSFACSSRDKRG